MPTLPELLSQSKSDIEEISKYFNELLAEAIQRVNANFSPQRLSKRTRQVEPLPTDKRQLSSYRTRIGTMLEYALSTEMNTIIKERYDQYLRQLSGFDFSAWAMNTTHWLQMFSDISNKNQIRCLRMYFLISRVKTSP